jgi:cytochrome c peroxidase
MLLVFLGGLNQNCTGKKGDWRFHVKSGLDYGNDSSSQSKSPHPVVQKEFETHEDIQEGTEMVSKMLGTDTMTSRKINGLNNIWSGKFGFTNTNTEGNSTLFTRRAQLSPDGKIWFSVNGNPSAIMSAVTWEIATVKPFSEAVKFDVKSETVNGFQLDQVLGPKFTMGTGPTENDNNGYDSNYHLGSQIAITFNPRFATKGIPMETDDGSCAIDKAPHFSPLDNAQFECLHLLIHQRGYDSQYCSRNDSSWNSDGGTIPCLQIAALVVLLKKNPGQNPSLMRAHLGGFRLMGFTLPSGEVKAMHQKTNEYAATSDSGLVFFVMLENESPSQMDKYGSEGVIGYTYSDVPYLPYSGSANWVSKKWSVPRSLWHLYEDFTEDPKRKSEKIRGIIGGFRKAYPMAQYPFRFANGVRIRDGLGRYQWFSPEGSDMLVNIGARSIAATLGRETRGIVKHLDSAAQVARGQYCVPYAADENHSPIAGAYCDPSRTETGEVRCSENVYCTQQSIVGTNIVGIQEYTSPGAASGFWAAPGSDKENAEPLLPFNRRQPLKHVLVNNKALLYFNPNTPVSSRGTHQWVYTEVANDDFNDPYFMAFFHMNEGIFNARSGKLNNHRQACDNGRGKTSCDIDVKHAFLDYNGTKEESLVADTSQNSYLGRLMPKSSRGAQFPRDYWKSKGIGERIQGNENGTGEVNPGFLGRAVHFYKESYIFVTNQANSASNESIDLANEKTAMTIELALRLNPEIIGNPPKAHNKSLANYSGLLVRQKDSWQLALHNGRVQFIYKLDSGAEKKVFLSDSISLSSEEWIHLGVTFAADKTDAKKLKLNLFVNGKPESSTEESLEFASLKERRGAELLCIGPGCLAGGDNTEIWIDELAISSIVRSRAYFAATANRTYTIAGLDADRSIEEFPKLVPKEDLEGLNLNKLRVPNSLLDLYNNDKKKFNDLKKLGRALFHDPILSSINQNVDNQRACSSCHAEATNFTSLTHLEKDIALGGGSLLVNTPTILNRAFSIRQFLDERSPHLLDQVTGPITNPLEMGGNLNMVMKRINGDGAGLKPVPIKSENLINLLISEPLEIPKGKGITTYQRWFCFAFTGNSICSEKFSTNHLRQVIATYELSLFSKYSHVDRMRAGESYKDEFSNNGIETSLKAGFQVFMGKGRCIGCHSGSNYSDELMHLNGPLDTLASGEKSPRAVKTPTLRGLVKSFPYFHDGSNALMPKQNWCQYDAGKPDSTNQAGSQLCKVVQFYNEGACRMTDRIKIRSYHDNKDSGRLDEYEVDDVACDPESVSLGLSKDEKQNLVEFLMHL